MFSPNTGKYGSEKTPYLDNFHAVGLSSVFTHSALNQSIHTAQKMKFSIKDFFSKCEQIRTFLRICSHLLKKSLMENSIFCAMSIGKLHLV